MQYVPTHSHSGSRIPSTDYLRGNGESTVSFRDAGRASGDNRNFQVLSPKIYEFPGEDLRLADSELGVLFNG